jgi:ketosteroid isomerase-like protein
VKRKLVLIINILALFVCGASASDGQSASGAQAEQQALRQIESEVSDAYLKGDTEILDRVLADEYTFTPPNGMVISKAAYLAMLQSGAVQYESFKPEGITVRVYGDAAMVMGLMTVKGKVPGHTINGQDRYLTVYVRRQGRWQQVATIAARVASSTAQTK